MCLFPEIGLYRGKRDGLWKHRKSFQLLSWSWAQLLLNYVMFTVSCILGVAARQELIFCRGEELHWTLVLARVIREMKESPVQSVKRSPTQQLLSLCKQFLVYPFNCHLRLLSTQARSYPFPEPSPWRGTEGSKEHSLLFPTRGPLVWLWGRRLQNPFPQHVLPLRRLLFAFMNPNTAWNPSVCWILVPPLHFSVCQAMLAAGYGLLTLWAITLWSEA